MRGGVSTRDAEGGDESDLRGGSNCRAEAVHRCAPTCSSQPAPQRVVGVDGSSGDAATGHRQQSERAERNRRQSDELEETKRRWHRP